MMLPKSCSRCLGDLIEDEVVGEIDVVCIQCGFRDLSITGDQFVAQQKALLGANGNPWSVPSPRTVGLDSLHLSGAK